MTPPSTVVFDLGNVLIPWDRRFLYGQLIDDPAELDYFLDNVLTLEVNAQLDGGMPLPEVADRLEAAHPDYAELIDAFRTRWIETVRDPIDGSVEILSALRGKVQLLALSNWGADTFASCRGNYPFLEWFDGLVISGQEGVVKPDPEIFHLLCERYGIEPAEAFFIDDSTKNIEAADRLGFGTHLFETPEALRANLVRLGLL